MGVEATLRAGEGVLDRPLRTRLVELDPRRRDELDQPGRLLGAGRQAAVGRRSPDHRGRIAQDRQALLVRQAEPEQRRPEPFHQQRTTIGIVAIRAPDSRCRRRCATPLLRGRRRPHRGEPGPSESAGVPSAMTASVTSASVPSSNRRADLDLPVAGQRCHEVGQFVDPTLRTGRDRPIPNHLGQLDHAGVTSRTVSDTMCDSQTLEVRPAQ